MFACQTIKISKRQSVISSEYAVSARCWEHTIIGVLSGDLSHGVPNLVPDHLQLLLGHAFE